jgi:hypothetical protein
MVPATARRLWQRPDRTGGPGGEASSRGCHDREEATVTQFCGGEGPWNSSESAGGGGGDGVEAALWRPGRQQPVREWWR